jgi:hypothetical protein
MKLTEDQKVQIIKAVESLDANASWRSSSQVGFEFEEDSVTWQLQVKITQNPDDFLRLNPVIY